MLALGPRGVGGEGSAGRPEGLAEPVPEVQERRAVNRRAEHRTSLPPCHTRTPPPPQYGRGPATEGGDACGLISCLCAPAGAHRPRPARGSEGAGLHGPESRTRPGLRLAVTRPCHRPSPGLSPPWDTTRGAGGRRAETPALRAGARPAGEQLAGTVPHVRRPPPRPRGRPFPLLRPTPTPRVPAPRAAARDPLTMAGAGADAAKRQVAAGQRGGAGPSGQRAGRGGTARARPPVIVNSAATRALGLCPFPALSSGLSSPGAQGLKTWGLGACGLPHLNRSLPLTGRVTLGVRLPFSFLKTTDGGIDL